MTGYAAEIVTTTSLLDWVDLRHLHALTGQAEGAFSLVIVKELVDNAIDAAERASVAPRVAVAVVADTHGWHIQVGDNGGGISVDQLVRISDFHTRASSKDWRRATSRGQQGNAWKTVIGIAAAYVRRDNPHATLCRAVEVTSGGRSWTVDVRVDSGVRAEVGEKLDSEETLGKPRGDHFPDFSPSTVVRCRLPRNLEIDLGALRQLVRAYAAVNPHLEIRLSIENESERIEP